MMEYMADSCRDRRRASHTVALDIDSEPNTAGSGGPLGVMSDGNYAKEGRKLIK